MTAVEQAIARTEEWLDALDRERVDVAALLAELRVLHARNLPALLLEVRPRRFVQLKAALSRQQRRRREA